MRDKVSAVILAVGIGLMIGFVSGVKASDVMDQVEERWNPPTASEVALDNYVGCA